MINKLIFLYAVLLLGSISNLAISCSQNNKNKGSINPSSNSRHLLSVNSDSFSRQVIIAFGNGTKSTHGFLYGMEDIKGKWALTFDTTSCEFGTKGIAGHGKKTEGDGKTPSGVYSIGPAFGYKQDIQSSLEFVVLTENHYWITDTSSLQYNQMVGFYPSGVISEKMKRGDFLYKYGIVIQYNTEHVVKGKGSAIFIHVERGRGKPTAGCIAVSEEDIKKLLHWANPMKQPSITIGNLRDDIFLKSIPMIGSIVESSEWINK